MHVVCVLEKLLTILHLKISHFICLNDSNLRSDQNAHFKSSMTNFIIKILQGSKRQNFNSLDTIDVEAINFDKEATILYAYRLIYSIISFDDHEM